MLVQSGSGSHRSSHLAGTLASMGDFRWQACLLAGCAEILAEPGAIMP